MGRSLDKYVHWGLKTLLLFATNARRFYQTENKDRENKQPAGLRFERQ